MNILQKIEHGFARGGHKAGNKVSGHSGISKTAVSMKPDPNADWDAMLAAGPQNTSALTGPGNTLGGSYTQYAPGAPMTAAQVQADQVAAKAATYKDYAGGKTFGALQTRATEAGPSPWLKLGLERQGIEQGAATDQAASNASSAGAQARAALASKGGLSSGAAERLATSSGRDLNAARADVSRQGALNRLSMSSQDEANKLGLLGTAAQMETGIGMENAARNLQNSQFNSGQNLEGQKFNAGTGLDSQKFNVGSSLDTQKYNLGEKAARDQFNIQNTLGEMGAQRQFNLGNYQTQLAGMAAEKSGQAFAKSGKK